MERLKQLGAEALAFLRALVWPVTSSVRDNVGLAALSVVLGFALWIFVTDTENPTRSGVLPFRLEVEHLNLPGDLVVANSIADVRVRVEVDQDVWDTLSPADFRATIDLDGLQVGTYDLPVRVEPMTGRGNLEVINATPESVAVDLEPFFTKSVPVSIELEEVRSDYQATIVDQSVDTVLVTGPRDRVSKVDKALGRLDLTGRTDDVDQAVRLRAVDQRMQPVDGVTLEPSAVNVSVEIAQVEFSTTLRVEEVIVGSPQSGYDVVDESVEPLTVTVFGPQSFIANAVTIRTQPIDITGASEDVVKTVALDLPADVSVSGGTSVTVTVKIEPAEGRRTLGITVAAVGLDAELSISGALPLVEVVLLGELPSLQELRPNDVAATINLSGLGAGTHEIAVAVSAPAGASVAAVSPAKVSVTLEPR